MIRVLVADDHAIVRRGLKLILSEEFDRLIVGEAQNGKELIEQIEKDDWQVVVLDITMPGKSWTRSFEGDQTITATFTRADSEYAFRGSVCTAGFQGWCGWIYDQGECP